MPKLDTLPFCLLPCCQFPFCQVSFCHLSTTVLSTNWLFRQPPSLLFCKISFCPRACIIRLITAVIYGFRNKLECLPLASISSPVLCLGTNTMAVINFMIQAPVPFCLARTFLGIRQTTLKLLTVFRQVCLNAQIIRGLFNETLKTCNLR
jgi:hypothetical protein